jgi:hypothetical protein
VGVFIRSWWIFSIPILSGRKTWRQIFAPLPPSIVTIGFRKLSELIKACLTPWFSFGNSVITVYVPELCFMLFEMRIPVISWVHRDGRGPGTFWTPCISWNPQQSDTRHRYQACPGLGDARWYVYHGLNDSIGVFICGSLVTDNQGIANINERSQTSICKEFSFFRELYLRN